VTKRDRSVTRKIEEIKEKLKDDIYAFIEKFETDILIPERGKRGQSLNCELLLTRALSIDNCGYHE
jgi:hypothetical protein